MTARWSGAVSVRATVDGAAVAGVARFFIEPGDWVAKIVVQSPPVDVLNAKVLFVTLHRMPETTVTGVVSNYSLNGPPFEIEFEVKCNDGLPLPP